jgi:hypothetical protein
MSKVLISILSDHIIPNYLYIKETEGMYDEMVFVTTEYAEKKEIGIHLENTLSLPPESVRRIKISNENFALISEELKNEKIDKGNEYCINQTGGTKAMSIALYKFFQDYDADFVYIPIGTNEYFDFCDDMSHLINYRLSLKEYLSLYGMTFESDDSLIFDEQYTNNVFETLKKRKFYLNSIFNIINAQSQPTPEEKKYWGGAWFEEYAYNRIRNEFLLPVEAIGMSVKIYRKNSLVNDNEIDVAFVKDNVLNVVECKVSMIGYGEEPKDTVEKYLYKLAAISKDLGLHVNSYLFTLHQMYRFPKITLENIKKRTSILGIKGIYDGEQLSEDTLNL